MKANVRSNVLCVSFLLLGACATTEGSKAPTRGAVDATKATPEECERRSRAMASQDQAMRADPDPGDYRGEPRAMGQWGAQVDPCAEARQERAAEDIDPRLLGMTRARAALDSDRPVDAFNAISSAFGDGYPENSELRALALEASERFGQHALPKHREVRRVGVRDGAAVCVFSSTPPVDDAVDELSWSFIGPTHVQVACKAPDRMPEVAQGEDAAILIHRRVGGGKFELVSEISLGPASALTPGELSRADFRPDQHARNTGEFYRASLIVKKSGHPPELLSAGGMIWLE